MQGDRAEESWDGGMTCVGSELQGCGKEDGCA